MRSYGLLSILFLFLATSVALFYGLAMTQGKSFYVSYLFVESTILALAFFFYHRQEQRRLNRLTKSITRYGETSGEGEELLAKEAEHPVYSSLIQGFQSVLFRQNERIHHLLLTQERHKTILELLHSVVILINRNGTVSYINPSGEKQFGLSRIELIGKPHWRIGSTSGLSLMINDAMQKKQSIIKEIILSSKKLMECSIVPHMVGQTMEGVFVLLHDITQRGELEKLRKDFMANVSHELRTPLTAIQGYAETLLNGAMYEQEMMQDFLKIIYNESLRLNKMVNDLLDLSRIEHLKSPLFEKVDIAEIILSTVKMLELTAKERGLDLFAQLPNNIVNIEGNRDLLTQLVLNLVSNALKYTDRGEVKVSLVEEDKAVKVAVEDTGQGIEPEHLTRIFERFYRVDPSRTPASGGRGLGLSIVKHIVQQHQGEIDVSSKPGKGTTFVVTLPKLHES